MFEIEQYAKILEPKQFHVHILLIMTNMTCMMLQCCHIKHFYCLVVTMTGDSDQSV